MDIGTVPIAIGIKGTRGSGGTMVQGLSGTLYQLTQVHSRELRNTQTDVIVPLKTSSNSKKSFSYHGTKIWMLLNNDQKAPLP